MVTAATPVTQEHGFFPEWESVENYALPAALYAFAPAVLHAGVIAKQHGFRKINPVLVLADITSGVGGMCGIGAGFAAANGYTGLALTLEAVGCGLDKLDGGIARCKISRRFAAKFWSTEVARDPKFIEPGVLRVSGKLHEAGALVDDFWDLHTGFGASLAVALPWMMQKDSAGTEPAANDPASENSSIGNGAEILAAGYTAATAWRLWRFLQLKGALDQKFFSGVPAPLGAIITLSSQVAFGDGGGLIPLGVMGATAVAMTSFSQCFPKEPWDQTVKADFREALTKEVGKDNFETALKSAKRYGVGAGALLAGGAALYAYSESDSLSEGATKFIASLASVGGLLFAFLPAILSNIGTISGGNSQRDKIFRVVREVFFPALARKAPEVR